MSYSLKKKKASSILRTFITIQTYYLNRLCGAAYLSISNL